MKTDTTPRVVNKNGKLTQIWRARWCYIALVPTFAFLLVFLLYPAFIGVYRSFFRWKTSNYFEPKFDGIDNYIRLFKDEDFWGSFGTLLIFIVAGFITSFGVNLPFTYLIFRLRETKRGRFFQRAFVIPMMVPGMVVSMYWRFFYTHETGILDQLLKLIGKEEWIHLWLGEKGYAMMSLLLQGFPWAGGFTMLILLAGLLNVDPALEESARIDGASSWQVFLRVYLPLLVPQIKMLSILGMIGAIQDYGKQILFTNGRYGTTVPAFEMYQNAFGKGNYGYAAAQGVVLFVIILVITMLQQKFIKRADD